MRIRTWKTILPLALVLAGVALTYSNHFENPFHFDDSHTIVENSYIRNLHNAGLFFTDAKTFSTLPANRVYRPLIPLSLAFDYWLGKGLKPVWFQASTFVWLLALLTVMFALFRRIGEVARPGPEGLWVALTAAALFGVHPVISETINYIVQRAELYSTLGVAGGLLLYAAAPKLRKFGLYLVPVIAAMLSKPPAVVFPLLLFLWILLFEETSWRHALRRSIPSIAVTAAMACLISAMTPSGFTPGAISAYAYRITQPLVALRYFRAFFLPDQLSADTDHVAVQSPFQDFAWLGFLFMIGAAAAAVDCAKRREWRPVAFGLGWFLIALLPTALFPLAEVENDHRMFFPFAGLVLAVCWTAGHAVARLPRPAVAMGAAVILVVFATGTWERNRVWHSDESLWLDVTLKSPRNGRGLMNYGLSLMAKGDTRRALTYFNRALEFTPAYPILEVNLGVAYGALREDSAAESHFVRAISLGPKDATGHYFYARWLDQKGREPEAVRQLQEAVALNPDYDQSRYLLASIASRQSADGYLNLSLRYHREGRYSESIDAAKQALRLRPNFAEAYNNIAAAYEALGQWDEAIEAARQALRIRPDFTLAHNNLRWSEDQKRRNSHPQRTQHAAPTQISMLNPHQ